MLALLAESEPRPEGRGRKDKAQKGRKAKEGRATAVPKEGRAV